MADYVVAQASVLIVPSLKKFNKQLQIELARAQKLASPVTIDVEANTKKFVAEGMAAKKLLEKDPVNVKFRVVDATKQITEIRHRYEDLVRETKKGLLLQLKVVGLSVLPQLTQGLASANASIVELSRSALLLPGILSGVASSIASVVTGLGGVSDAFKEYGEAQKNAAQEGLKARNSARNVKNAYRDLGRSVKDAKRNLEDLNAELRGAPLDEADAIIRLAEAQAEAADKFQKSGLQQQKDLIDLKRAENELVEVRLRNSRLVEDAAEANAKGVAGADGVREATDRLAKAQDEAATRTSKLNDSLKEISPNAQSFVQAVTGMSDQWSAFKNVVQDRLFEGLDREITQLAQVSLPTLERGLGSIASALNDNVRTAMQVLQTPTNQGFFERIFGDTAEAQKNLSAAFDPFVDSFLRLSAVGTSFLPRLVEGLTDLLTRFDNFIVRAEGDGSLNNWIERGIDDLNALGNSIINLGSMLTSLSDAFTDSGGKTFFESLESGTGKLADFLRSPEGQDGLKRFFQEAREEFDKWEPLLSTIPGLLSNLSDAGQAFADVMLPFLSGASRLLSENKFLVDALLYSFIAWKGVFPILKAMKNGFDGLNAGIKLLSSLTAGAQGHIGKFAAITGTASSKVGDLTKALISPAGLISAATLAATWIGVNLVKAHDEAAQAAQRQKDDLDALKRSLDDVTGATTEFTREQVLKNTMEGINEATGQRYGDVFAGLDPKQAKAAVDSVVAGDRAGALDAVGGGVNASVVENTKFWDDFGPSLREAGLSADVVAQAVNGDPDAKAKFEQWFADVTRIPLIGNLPEGVRRGLDRSGIINSPNASLKDLQDQFSPEDQLKAARAGEINSAVTNLGKSQDQIRTNNERGFGRWRLKPNSPFDDLGVVVGPQVSADGGGLVTRSAPADGPQADAFRNDGVTFRPDGPDRYIVSIAPDKFKNYFDEYASGGLISGPGSGTSDSILARLSNGEFVVNAAATQRHLPLLQQINTDSVRGYAMGGLIGGGGLYAPPAPGVGGPSVAPKPEPEPKKSWWDKASSTLANVTTPSWWLDKAGISVPDAKLPGWAKAGADAALSLTAPQLKGLGGLGVPSFSPTDMSLRDVVDMPALPDFVAEGKNLASDSSLMSKGGSLLAMASMVPGGKLMKIADLSKAPKLGMSGIDASDLRYLDSETEDIIAANIRNLRDLSPETPIQRIEVSGDLGSPELDGAYAEAWAAEGLIRLNEEYFTNIPRLLDDMKADIDSAFGPKLGDNDAISSIIGHEFSHLIHNSPRLGLPKSKVRRPTTLDAESKMREAFDAKLNQVIDGEAYPDLDRIKAYPKLYESEFRSYSRGLLPDYAYYDKSRELFPSQALDDNESFAVAFEDVWNNAADAQVGSKILYNLLRKYSNSYGGNLPRVPVTDLYGENLLPGFAPGGPVQPKPPVVPDVASAYDNFLTGGGSPYPLSKPEPKRDQTRGISVVGEYAGKALGSVGRFFKSALGIGDPPEGYGETSVATIKPNKPNMGLPSTGQALSNAAGFLLPSEFGETRTARIVPNSVKYPKAPPKPKNPLSDLGQPFSADAMPSSGGSGLPQVLANVSNSSLEKPWGTDPATGKPWTGSSPKPAAPTPQTSKGSSAPPVKQTPPSQKPTSSGSGSSAPAGVPHTGSAARPGDYHDGRPGATPGPRVEPAYPEPSPSASVGAIAQGTGMPPAVVQQAVPPAVLSSPVGPALAQAALAQLPAYGLPKGTDITYGSGGFPDWVYQLGSQYGMLASTYGNHQEGSGFNRGIDWAPDGVAWNTPQGAEMMTKFAKYLASTGMMEQVIYQNPFTGETVGVYNGKLVGPGTDQPQYYSADWSGHQNHIHTRTSRQIPNPAQLAALGLSSSPSNMPFASTPTGVGLPQLSYAPGASILSQLIPGMSNAGGGMPSGQEMAANYMEYVADAWQDILLDLSQNLGNIAVSFIGGLTGLDFGPLMNVGNNIIDGLGGGLESLTAERDSGDGMGAVPAVNDILNSLGSLPPEYQEYAEKAIAANPNQAYEVLQTLNALANGQGGSAQYNPAGGAEQWRSTVRRILAEVAPRYGITNLKAWEDDIIGQINLESRGDPNAKNLNDSDGKGGTQQVFGLGQFHPDTFRNHNVIGGDISDPIAQIYAMIDYLASPKYGVVPGGGVNWKGFGWRNGKGYAAGGKITGPGSGSSDSIIARVSNGEFLVRAPMAQKHMGLLQAINANKLPGFADGMMWPINAPAPLTPPPPANAPPPPPSPIPPAPAGPAADALAGQPSAPAPVAEAQGAGDADSTALQEIGSALGGIGSSLTGNGGAEAPAGGSPTGDPRSVLGSAPQNLDHNKPAVSQGIQQAAGAISTAVSTAMSAAAAGAGGGPAGGAAAGAASAPITALIQAGGSAVAGAVNILSSLGVGTLTRSQTSGAYGTPLTPKGVGDQPYQGPGVVNNWNGGVHTSNNEEFFKIQQRRELQNASPYLPQR